MTILCRPSLNRLRASICCTFVIPVLEYRSMQLSSSCQLTNIYISGWADILIKNWKASEDFEPPALLLACAPVNMTGLRCRRSSVSIIQRWIALTRSLVLTNIMPRESASFPNACKINFRSSISFGLLWSGSIVYVCSLPWVSKRKIEFYTNTLFTRREKID